MPAFVVYDVYMPDIYTHHSDAPKRWYKIGVGFVDAEGQPLQENRMYERFTDRSRKVMQLSNQEAQRLNHEYIGTEHMLLGLIKEGSGVAANVLKNLDLDLNKCRVEVLKLVSPGPGPAVIIMGKLPMTPRTKRVLESAIQSALDLNHNYVGTEHLLLGLVTEREGIAAQVLMNFNVTVETVREEVLNLLGFNPRQVDAEAEADEQLEEGLALKEMLREWLTAWVGERHEYVNGCYTCECWEAFDTIFRHAR